MPEQRTPPATAADVTSLISKLQELSTGLTPGEQSALRVLIARAARGEDQDVRGFSFISEPHYWDWYFGPRLDAWFEESLSNLLAWYQDASTTPSLP